MSKINQIQKRLLELDGGTFQKVADAYLHQKGYKQINSLGSVIGKDKTKAGTPDTFIPLPSGKYVFAEYTTQQENVFDKIEDDLQKCFNETKTGISVDSIEEVVFCYTSTLSPEQHIYLFEKCRNQGVNINLFGMSTISYDLYQKYPGIARDFLSVEVDTGQIVSVAEFVAVYDRNRFSARLDAPFHFRKNELDQCLKALDSLNLLMISGRPGVGKTRFALESCKRFSEAHQEYEVSCVFSRGPDLFEDLRVHFSKPGSFLIIVDDANRISRFDYVVQLLASKRDDQNIKVVATVRDYALQQVREAAKAHASTREIGLEAMSDEEITGIIQAEFGIRNRHYLDRIIHIARGNPRLAVMAAQVAKRENTLQSINDVTDLYEEYFASIRKDLQDIGEPTLLVAAGIVVFFRAIDRSNQEIMKSIESAFAIREDVLWQAAHRLHELEVFDMYENEIIRTADQVLATYLFYRAFFKDRVVNFGALLEHFFPAFRSRFVDAIDPVLSTFDTSAIMEAMRPYVDRAWDKMEKANNEDGLLRLILLFWYIKQTDTLLYTRKRIEELTADPIEPAALDFKEAQDTSDPSLLRIIAQFRFADDDTFRIALELLLDYLAKKQAKLPNVLYLLKEPFCFTANDYLMGFNVQRAVMQTLWTRAKEGHELFGRLFLAIAEKYLHTHFHYTEAKNDKAVVFVKLDVPPIQELYEIRTAIWNGIFGLYNYEGFKERVLDVIYRYSSSRLEISSGEIVAHDSSTVLPFIESELNQSILRHCVVAKEYLEMLGDRNIDFPQAIGDRFESQTLKISKLLTLDLRDMRRMAMDYMECSRYRDERIREHFVHYSLEDYEVFFQQCYDIQAVCDQNNKKLQLQNGIIVVFRALADGNPDLFVTVFERYLMAGDRLRINASILVKRFVEIGGVEASFAVLNRCNFASKAGYLFLWHLFLPEEAATLDRLHHLYSLYQTAARSDVVSNLDYLLKYRRVDGRVVAKVTEIILNRTKTDSNFAVLLNDLCNPYTEINKTVGKFFDGDLVLLKRAYLALTSGERYADYGGHTFSQIMDLDGDFILEYIDYMYEKEEYWSRYDDCDYSFIWRRADSDDVITRIADRLYKHEIELGLLSMTRLLNFFRPGGDGKTEPGIREKQDRLLSQFIAQRYGDADFMEVVFAVIAEFPPPRRKPFVSLFLNYNKDFKTFEKLKLEPYSQSYEGSAVPMLQEKLEYYEALLPFANTVQLLKHKQNLEQEIQAIRSRIEYEKKIDFIGN